MGETTLSTKPTKSSANNSSLITSNWQMTSTMYKYFTNITQKIKEDIPPTVPLEKTFVITWHGMGRRVQNSFFFTSITLFGLILAQIKFGAIGAKWQKSPN